jgi:hypothetical protein
VIPHGAGCELGRARRGALPAPPGIGIFLKTLNKLPVYILLTILTWRLSENVVP